MFNSILGKTPGIGKIIINCLNLIFIYKTAMPLKSKKILVTGVAGFLGSHLSEKLVNLGHKVVGIDNMLGGYDDNVPKNIEFHKGDCCDFEKIKSIMKGVDVVYHCAATAH